MNALLYADPSPSLRYRAAVELDGATADDADVRQWRNEIASSPAVRSLLGLLEHLAASPRQAGYVLCQLAYLGYRGPETDAAAERIFAHQLAEGCWPTREPEADVQPAVAGASAAPASKARARRRRGEAPPRRPPSESYRVVTMDTVAPLRGVAAAGYATDERAERAYDWLEGQRLVDGSWTGSHKADLGLDAHSSGEDPDYRKLTRGAGCRSATTGAVAAFVLHPTRCRSEAARIGVDHLLARETREPANLGFEVSRLVGVERAQGRFTLHVVPDHAFVLDLASRCGVSADDRRVREMTAYLETLRGPFGLWQHHAHPQLSRWLTFDLEATLRRLHDGDWVGNEEPASFTPYVRPRARY